MVKVKPDASKCPRYPLSYVEALRAVHRPRTDEENAFLHAEIKRRYALHQRRRREADPIHFMAVRRIDELEHVFFDRYGLCLPDDDAGWEDFTIVAHHFAHLRGSADQNVARIVGWAAIWAPSFPPGKVTALAEEAVAKPWKWKAETLARKLGLTMEQRTRLKIKTIGAINVKPKDRPTWLAAHHRQRKEAERRANGVRPRDLANSDSAKKWWVAMGMSRATWYRKGKPIPETEQELKPAARQPEPARETATAAYTVNISSAVPVSSILDTDGLAIQGLGQKQVSRQQNAAPKSVGKVEPVITAAPNRKRGTGMTVKQNAKVQMEMRLLRQEIMEREAILTVALDQPDSNRSNAVTRRTIGKFKMRSEASLNRELRQLRLRVIEMEHQAKRLIGDAAFAAFEDDFTNKIEQDADTSNVVRLRRLVR